MPQTEKAAGPILPSQSIPGICGRKTILSDPRIPVTRQTPATFLLQAENDPIDPVQNSLAYWAELKQAGVPVEMHLYAEGGHAFGLRRTEFPITEWSKLVERWLLTIGITPK